MVGFKVQSATVTLMECMMLPNMVKVECVITSFSSDSYVSEIANYFADSICKNLSIMQA